MKIRAVLSFESFYQKPCMVKRHLFNRSGGAGDAANHIERVLRSYQLGWSALCPKYQIGDE
jgi:hypothetical protein